MVRGQQRAFWGRQRISKPAFSADRGRRMPEGSEMGARCAGRMVGRECGVLREKEEQHKVSGRSGWGQIKAYGHGRNLSLFPMKSGVSEGF